MSASTDPTTSVSRTPRDDSWWDAVGIYLMAYCVATIALDLAEPSSATLFIPAVCVGAFVKLVTMAGRVPRGPVMGLVYGVLPIIVAVVVIALMA